jgi:EAL domain-containing protein (putative c-di-GMP-specific phosphodiesterase class I)
MSVNLTSKEFAQPDLVGEIRNSLEQTGVDPGCLQLEIIETIAMGDAEKSGYVLSQLKALGVRLSIDDFGTGYSSLGRLRRIPVDTLKIDRSFISNMDSDPENPGNRADYHHARPQFRFEGRSRRNRNRGADNPT